MISLVLASMLMAAPPASPPDTGPQRKAFSSCLSGVLKEKSGEKIAIAEFEQALKAKCAAQEATFRTALINADMKMGTKRPAAEQNAEMDITEYITNVKDSFEAAAPPQ